MRATDLIIATGVSGSGKSTGLNALEDLGFFCIDNLPAPLMTNLVEFLLNLPSTDPLPQVPGTNIPLGRVGYERFALLVDCRDKQSFPLIQFAVDRLRGAGTKVSLIYFDAQDDVLIRRFQETRRPHPLLLGNRVGHTIIDALATERAMLADFREAANLVVDTSLSSPHDLRRTIESFVQNKPKLEISISSFGFKYGIPSDADLVVDVRFLPNPHFVPELRDFTGRDQKIVDYVLQSAESSEFLQHYLSLLEFLVPKYQQEGKRYLHIAVGCTGGKHRSVAIAERIAPRIRDLGYDVNVRHRDIERQ